MVAAPNIYLKLVVWSSKNRCIDLILLAPFSNQQNDVCCFVGCHFVAFEVGNLVLIMWEADQDAKCFPEYYGALTLQ